MPLSLRQANLSYQVPCITFPLSSMPSHFWPNLSYSSRFTWVPCPPRSLPDYSHSSGIPFWEFHGNTTSLTLLCRESTVALWISLILPTKLQVLWGQGFFFFKLLYHLRQLFQDSAHSNDSINTWNLLNEYIIPRTYFYSFYQTLQVLILISSSVSSSGICQTYSNNHINETYGYSKWRQRGRRSSAKIIWREVGFCRSHKQRGLSSILHCHYLLSIR